MLSGRGLCDELITRPEESYRLWCVIVCDLENLKNEEAMTRVGLQRHKKKYIYNIYKTNNLLPMQLKTSWRKDPISMADRSKAWVSGGSLYGNAGSNTAESMAVCLL